MPREGPRVTGALNGDREVSSPVRKQRLPKSKDQLVKEASEVLHRADRVSCVVQNSGSHPEKYFTLPARKKHKPEFSQASLERPTRRRNSEELASPPRKPPRTFANTRNKSPQRTSIFSIFKKTETPAPPPKKKSNLRRSVSDATALKASNDVTPVRKRSDSDAKEVLSTLKASKKQLSPIIEVTQREDYFQPHNKENVDADHHKNEERPKSITEQLQEYIDEVDADLFNETGIRISPPKDKPQKLQPQPVIIDVDNADQISKKKSKSLGNKLKALTKRATEKKKNKTKTKEVKPVSRSISVKPRPRTEKPLTRTKSLEDLKPKEVPSVSPNIQKVIDSFESKNKETENMIHSSQKPAEKLPLTKGRAVDNMVKRLSRESTSPPPPKTNIIITPSVSVQHNNNQPFSYTRGISPEKNDTSTSPKPIIYAQVVCNNKSKPGNNTKQTVHTTYINGKKNVPHSDSDEGLGYEENSGFRKYEDKPVTQFGDRYNHKKSNDFFHEDRFEEEYPITPKFKNVNYNGFSSYESENYESKQNGTTKYFIDSSSRGRGDGMDAKRRESLTEPENGLKYNGGNNMFDLSARRDLLESRINRRFAEKTYRQSPEYSPKPLHNNVNNVYITENSRYYRGGSASPVCLKDKYTSETIIDNKGEKHHTESRSRKYFGEPEYNRYKDDYRYNSYDNEPKSFDSQISDYRSSPENNRYFETSQNHRSPHQDKYLSKSKPQKDREIYKSNPEIHHRSYDGYKYDSERYQETYHDSLKREKHENRVNGKYRTERYFDQNDNERKDKFGDSGIENDFRRDSGDNFKLPRSDKQKRELSNESEDEGFASSLLIASERQHTEDNFARRRREYEMKINGRDSKERDDHFRNLESMDYKYKTKDRYEYSPRERSIDDGSHYDPRLDKEHDRGTLKKVEKKPPKPEKKSSLEKVKSLFTRDSKKKKEKERNMVPEENLRSRYTEYRGSREQLEPKIKRKEVNEVNTSYNYNNRRRLSTPSPTREPPRTIEKQPENTHSSWFKSLDRLSRKKSKKSDKDSSSDEMPIKSTPTKNLRFFGDTDIESNDSLRKKSSLKQRPSLTSGRVKSQSTRDLHNISEEIGTPEMRRVHNHKSMLNISESDRETKGSRTNLKPPMSPNHRHHREGSRGRDDRLRRRKNEVSSVESSTEGDSSQQSQRSVVYLHAATVGDIPGPGYLKNGRRAASREELTSNGSSRIQPQVKTLSRSFSVLAPWRPKHFKESMDIDYTQYPKPVKNSKYEQRPMRNGSSRKETSSTLKKKAQETRRSNQNVSTLNRRSRSKENVSTLKRGKDEPPRGSNSTLYKKKEKQGRENNRYTSSRDDRKMSSKSMSVESLGAASGASRSSRKSREEVREVSRSISMPRDPEKSAGWFKMNKKSKKSGSTQRL